MPRANSQTSDLTEMFLGKLDRNNPSQLVVPVCSHSAAFQGPSAAVCLQEKNAEEPTWLWLIAYLCGFGRQSHLLPFSFMPLKCRHQLLGFLKNLLI